LNPYGRRGSMIFAKEENKKTPSGAEQVAEKGLNSSGE
jgi:hypothetical protein